MTTDTLATRDELLSRSARNLGDMLRRRVDQTPDATAFLYPENNAGGPEKWTPLTWREVQDRAHDIAAGLLDLGLGPEQRVAICADTSVWWILTDLGIGCAGGATTTVYGNSQPEDVEYILTSSESRIYVAQNSAQAAKVEHSPALDELVTHIILVDDDRLIQGAPGSDRRLVAEDTRVISLADLSARGHAARQADPGAVQRVIDATAPDHLATLIYTSGTTGKPKGVELTHQSWTYMGVAMESWDPLEPGDLQYLWLPLAHVFGKCLIAVQMTIGFSSAVDGRVERIVTGMGEVHPTFMCGVPRIFEKVRAKVITSRGLARTISSWAFRVGERTAPYRLEDRPLPARLSGQQLLAEKLVFSKLKQAMGGRLRMMSCGGAKLSPQVQRWFFAAGIPVVEGYGATETSAIAFFNVPKKGRFGPRFGTAGPVCPGCEARIAEDGEVLVRGPIVARGYHELPEKTAETFTDGWYHTGDIGHFDELNYLVVTERKRDLIKTSGGKYIAPQKVETTLMANCPYLSQAVVLGEGHKFAVALLTLDREALFKWAENHGHAGDSYEKLTQLPEIRRSIQRFVDVANSRLDRWETVKRFAILDHELDGQKGLVTESQKVRRDQVRKRYKKEIEELYADEQTASREDPER
ncbi:AMP-dependent synthetase/ligase [Acidipropionibacterium jensenii]|uniref:AMP-dependent synthetase/ligase n=1 Tax=Acidipropionibacterium jensenii TaxID=1749 RepID=UPI00264860A1|nr:long-chain fatty acid--CoA ligase [Acidipropionibacterium jensenii]MDN6425727.1 long-chain fatty acid--CoA ligase [Acidipropionibacterium jensenii]